MIDDDIKRDGVMGGSVSQLTFNLVKLVSFDESLLSAKEAAFLESHQEEDDADPIFHIRVGGPVSDEDPVPLSAPSVPSPSSSSTKPSKKRKSPTPEEFPSSLKLVSRTKRPRLSNDS